MCNVPYCNYPVCDKCGSVCKMCKNYKKKFEFDDHFITSKERLLQKYYNENGDGDEVDLISDIERNQGVLDLQMVGKYFRCVQCVNQLEKNNYRMCYNCKIHWCNNCSKFCLAGLNKKDKFVCSQCSSKRKKYKHITIIIAKSFNKYIGTFLQPYLCDDLVGLVKQYIMNPLKYSSNPRKDLCLDFQKFKEFYNLL